MGGSWCRLPRSHLPSPVRPGSAPECEAGASPDIPRGCVVGTAETNTSSRRKPVSDFQAIADRVEIEALRGEFTDAVVMNDHARLASLFTPGGVVRIPLGHIESAGREQIRALGRRRGFAEFFVETTPPGRVPVRR